jgi:hypothetical protein
MRENLFAFDCGSTNWRLYRVTYEVERQAVRMMGEPQPAPLTSFVERRLPTVILLNPVNQKIDSFGEAAYQYLYDEKVRPYIRDFFKPCIGAHLLPRPLSHQTRYTHSEALNYTKLLLEVVLEQLRVEKWRSRPFDETLRFAFTYPVHWRDEYGGQILNEFKAMVTACFPPQLTAQLNFITEPEAALLSLQHQGLLDRSGGVILLIDSGGSTTDLTAGRLNPRGELTAVHRYGEPHGGGLYDEEVARYIAEELRIPDAELTADPTAIYLLRMYARQLKEALSRQLSQATPMPAPPQRAITLALQNGQVYRRTVSLNEDTFNRITRHLQSDFQYLIDNSLRTMRLSERDITQVALVGGSAQLFTVGRYLRQRFGAEKVVLADNPAEAVVHGLALEYGYAFGAAQPWLRPAEHPSLVLPEARLPEPSRPMPTPPPNLNPPPRYSRPMPPILDAGETVVETSLEPTWHLVDDKGQHYSLNNSVISLGRAQTNDIVLFDNKASRNHAQINTTPTYCEIVDLGSANGTYVNRRKLVANQPQKLQPNDLIQIGPMKFTFIV